MYKSAQIFIKKLFTYQQCSTWNIRIYCETYNKFKKIQNILLIKKKEILKLLK